MSAQSAVGTFVVVGTAYLIAEAMAEVVLVGIIGASVGYLVIGLLAIVAAVTFVTALVRAVSDGDKAWMFDIFAAPLSASIIAFLTYPIDIKILNGFISFLNDLPSYSPNVDDGLTLRGFLIDFVAIIVCLMLFVAIALIVGGAVLAAPFAAIFYMNSDERYVRIAGYGCYLFTAFYWQTAVLAVHRGQGSF